MDDTTGPWVLVQSLHEVLIRGICTCFCELCGLVQLLYILYGCITATFVAVFQFTFLVPAYPVV